MASLIAAVLVVLAMVVLGEYTKTRGRLFLTALSCAGFCLLALTPAALSQRPGPSVLGNAGLGVVALGLLLVLVGIWGTPNSDAYWKATGILSIAAGSLAYLCWLLLVEPLFLLARTVRRLAAGTAGLALALATLGIVAEIKSPAFWWAFTLTVILQMVGGIAFRVLNRRR